MAPLQCYGGRLEANGAYPLIVPCFNAALVNLGHSFSMLPLHLFVHIHKVT
jgi:hypothetical protein